MLDDGTYSPRLDFLVTESHRPSHYPLPPLYHHVDLGPSGYLRIDIRWIDGVSVFDDSIFLQISSTAMSQVAKQSHRTNRVSRTRHRLRRALLAGVERLESRLVLAAGSLDLSFGTSGFATADFFNADDIAASVVIQGDGKLLTAGTASVNSAHADFGVARFNTDGSLDSSFGSGGRVSTDFGGRLELVLSSAIQGDGKLVVVGGSRISDTSPYDFALARYNPNGTLDASFGNAGTIITDLGFDDIATAVAIQADGKIVVVGMNNDTSPAHSVYIAIVRYNSDGSIDTSFGTNGKTSTNSLNGVQTAILQPDGKILVGGSTFTGSGYDFTVARFSADGFKEWQTNTDFAGSSDQTHTLALQPDGKILAGGYFYSPATGTDFAMARYNADGSLDSSFGVNGKVTTGFASGSGYDYVNGLAVESNGMIIAVGQTNDQGNLNFAIAGYNADGTLNSNFGIDGKVTTDFGGHLDIGSAVAVQSNGQFVVAGRVEDPLGHSDFAVARYFGDVDGSGSQNHSPEITSLRLLSNTIVENDDASLTVFFDDADSRDTHTAVIDWGDGSQSTTIAFEAGVRQFHAVHQYLDDNPTGTSSDSASITVTVIDDHNATSTQGVMIAIQNAIPRFNRINDDARDPTFGIDGIVTTDFNGGSDAISAIAIQPDGKIIGVGNASGGQSIALARYNADGSLDPSFGIGGRVTTSVGNGASAGPVAVQRDGKIVVGASTGFSWILARYDSDGQLDTTFGLGGILIKRFGATYETPFDIAIQPDGKIIAAGYAGSSHGYYDFILFRCNADGSLDDGTLSDSTPGDAFGVDSYVRTDLNASDVAWGMALQPDGKIVVAGRTGGLFQSDAFALVRYNSDGTLDPGFGTAGVVTTSLAGTEGANDVAITTDGQIVVGGNTTIHGVNEFALLRYTTDGQLDTHFGTNGMATAGVITPIYGVQSLALQPDGKIVAAGTTTNGNQTENFGLVRFNPDGTLDNKFGANGVVIADFFGGSDQAQTVRVQADGRIVVAGYAQQISGDIDFALVRFGASVNDFSLDSDSIDENGTITASGTIIDPGTLDTHTVVIDWGAGQGTTSLTLPAGVVSFHATHQYSDNPSTGSATDIYSIRATVADDDGGTSTTTRSVKVNNIAPTATLESNSGISYGNSVVASLNNPFDPSNVDTSAGLHYVFSLDSDTTDTASYENSSTSNSANFGLVNAGAHSIFARVIDKDGGSNWYSTSMVVNKAAPTIAWSNPMDIRYGTTLGSTQLNATVTGISGGSPLGSMVYSPSLGSLLGAGDQQALTVSVAETANYNAATQTVLINVNKASLTITANNATRVYSATTPGLSVAYSGFVNDEQARNLNGSLLFSPSDPSALAPGVYSIVPSGLTSTNYAINFVSGTLTILPIGVTDGRLVIYATEGRDFVDISKHGSSYRVDFRFDARWIDHRDDHDWNDSHEDDDDDCHEHNNRFQHMTIGTDGISSMLIVGRSGNDCILVARSVTIPTNIDAGGGDNEIWSGSSNDRIYTGNGNNIIHSGDGDDTIVTGTGDDRIWSGGGDDTIDASDGDNTVYSGSGNDSVTTGSGRDTINAGSGDDLVRAGGGNDSIQGGSGNDILIGGTGDDLILGGEGRDLIIGGIGADRIVGNQDDDILIAGYTAYDNDSLGLRSLMKEWTNGNSYRTRINNITNGSGMTGGFRLVGDDGALQTVFDDNQVDTLTGSQGTDWFFANRIADDGGPLDIVTDKSAEELWNDIDF